MSHQLTTTPQQAPAGAGTESVGSYLKSRFASGTGGALLGLVLLFIVLSFLAPNFLTARNLINVVDQVTVLGILAVGATAVIITGGIDLSVGSVLALSTMVLGWLSHDGGWPLWAAMLAAVAVGAAAGSLNGLGVTFAHLPPFIATLAMMSIARGWRT
jgi:ribose transport system permease protein